MALKTKPFNIQDYLKTPKDRQEYLQVALESGDLEDIAMAIGDIAKARGVAAFAAQSGLNRQTIYQQFKAGGNPRIATLGKALRTLGLEVHVSGVPRA